MKFSELCAVYAEVRKGELRSWATVAGHQRHLARILDPNNDREIWSFSKQDVDVYRVQRRKETTANGGLTKPATRNHEMSTLRAMLNFAVLRSWLPANPIGKLKHEYENNIRQTLLRGEDEPRLLNACRRWLRGMVEIVIDHGLQKDEVRRLEQGQIDKGLLSVGRGKRARILTLSPRAAEAISIAIHRGYPETTYVFTGETGLLYGKATVDEAFRVAVRKARIQCSPGEGLLRFSDLIRTHVDRARRAGVHPSTIKKGTGHTSAESFETRRNNTVAPDELAVATARLDASRVATTARRIQASDWSPPVHLGAFDSEENLTNVGVDPLAFSAQRWLARPPQAGDGR